MSLGPALLCDIGGTNARFALHEAGVTGAVTALPTAGYPSFIEAARAFLRENGTTPVQAVLSVAGPVTDGRAQLTNAAWSIDAEGLREALGLTRAIVVNDFLALAHSLPGLSPADLDEIGQAPSGASGPLAVIGPGTGFGAALYLPDGGGGGRVVPTEAGHATLAAGNEREAAVIAQLRKELDHVAVEDVVSGPGLERLDAALAKTPGGRRSAAEIVAAACAGEVRASETLNVFFALLGSVAGNMAVTTGATGGVFLAGGILPRLATPLKRSEFRRRFEAKGRMAPYLKAIPTWLITVSHPAFRGLARLAETPFDSPESQR